MSLSALCLECGLCCDGTLFRQVKISPAERDELVALGIGVGQKSKHDVMWLPCGKLDGKCCTIYEARPDVMAVVHAHAEDTLPFGIAPAKLRPVIHSGAFIGAEVPVWDIAKRFGDRTNLLVTNAAQGRDLAKSLRKNNVVLMRGHGFAAAATSLIDVVRMSVYLPRNARVQFRAMQLGRIKPLSKGEIQARTGGTGYKPQSPETQRAWQYWAERAGCVDLLKQLS